MTAKNAFNKTIIAVLTFAALLFCSCCGVSVDYFEYCRHDFRARVLGEIDGVDIDAVVRYSPVDSVESEAVPIMTVVFSSPESLDGIVATLYSDGKSAVRLGNCTDGSGDFDGLLLPFLLLCPSEKYSSINIGNDGRAEVVFSDDGREVSYSFDADGKLCRIVGRAGERSFDLKIIFEG